MNNTSLAPSPRLWCTRKLRIMNKIFIYLFLILSFYNLSFSNILSMETEPESMQPEVANQAKTNTDQQALTEECADQFISFLNSDSGTIVIDLFSNRELEVELLQKVLNITNNANLIKRIFYFLQILYFDKEIFFTKSVQEEMKFAFASYIRGEAKEFPTLADELNETLKAIINKTEEPSFKQILLIFSDLIGYKNVRDAIGREIAFKTNLFPFEGFEEWRQNRWCVIL